MILTIRILYLRLVSKHEDNRKKGAIFCQVKRIRLLFQVSPSEICGTHIWNGAPPSLTISLSIINEEKRLIDDKKENNDLALNALEIRMADAKACTRKYFKDASELRGDFSAINNASKASILISSPIHAIIQEEAEIAIRDPTIKIRVNMNFHGRIRIKRRISP